MAYAAGVVLTGCDGDQPGVQLNLVRFVRGIGLEPLVCGNIKGLQDPYRTPTTQRGVRRALGPGPAHGDQLRRRNEDQLRAGDRGQRHRDDGGPAGHARPATTPDTSTSSPRPTTSTSWRASAAWWTTWSAAEPGPGVFVLATHHDPQQRHYLELYKLGPGPLYSFYTPYHLCHFEVPQTVARAVLFDDAAIAPVGAPTVEVVTTAKQDLRAGTVLDGLGGYDTYGQAERADVTAGETCSRWGWPRAPGCASTSPGTRSSATPTSTCPAGRLVDRLRDQQSGRVAHARHHRSVTDHVHRRCTAGPLGSFGVPCRPPMGLHPSRARLSRWVAGGLVGMGARPSAEALVSVRSIAVDGAGLERAAESAALAMSTRPLFKTAAQQVRADPDDLRNRTKVGAKPNTQIISVTVTAPTSEQAAREANAVAAAAVAAGGASIPDAARAGHRGHSAS